MQNKTYELVDRAVGGDKNALEELLVEVQDMVYNLSLRMLGSTHDAEDASQEIYIRIMTGLSSFKKESAFTTWVYRIAVNHLLNYKKSFFSKQPPLSFEFYGKDIEAGFIKNNPDMMGGVLEDVLAEELKMSCTNVMLQCFDNESRLIYVLGIMFKIDSKICGEIFGITPEAYRQRLSRIKQKMADFMSEYCGLSSSEKCSCKKRIGYAITTHRLNPSNLEYTHLEIKEDDMITEYIEAMEELDNQSMIFSKLPKYRSPKILNDYVKNLLQSDILKTVTNYNN